MSDRIRTAPDVKFVHPGPGLVQRFRCDRCDQSRPMLGRKKTRFGYVCGACVLQRNVGIRG